MSLRARLGRSINLRNKKAVLIGLLVVLLIIFVAGMGAAWSVRNTTICKDGKPPVAQKGGTLLPTIYKCHNGQMITASQG
jgi:hypothetical protein